PASDHHTTPPTTPRTDPPTAAPTTPPTTPPTATNTAAATRTPPFGPYLAAIFKIGPGPTPTPTITPPPAGVVPNGTFELGHVSWVEISDYPYPLITTQFPGTIKPHGAIWANLLGGVYVTSTDNAL